MKRLLLLFILIFSCGLFALDVDDKYLLKGEIRSLFYKCEMEMRLYQDDPHMTWYIIGKMAAYDEVLELLEED